MTVIAASINLSKVDKTKFFVNKHGEKCLDVVLIESKERKFENDFMVVQGLPKQDRDAGLKGAILGNAKYLGQAGAPKSETKVAGKLSVADTIAEDDGSSVPF
jgi:hypothetical protein